MHTPTFLSPLRYPGGKRRLVEYIGALLQANGAKPRILVEPFLGGGSVSLGLLSRGIVEGIIVSDRDPLVSAFWQVVFSPNVSDLIQRIDETPVTLEQYKIIKATQYTSLEEKAFACLFLNRTSYSGIISRTSGPIGGMKQQSDYKIDCRFPKQSIIGRIKKLNDIRDRVIVLPCYSYNQTIDLIEKQLLNTIRPEDVTYYFDPPFFKEADRLYDCFFEDSDHTALRDKIESISGRWILSYDWAPEIKALYKNSITNNIEIDIYYSANRARRGREILLTNFPSTPKYRHKKPKKNGNPGFIVIEDHVSDQSMLKGRAATGRKEASGA